MSFCFNALQSSTLFNQIILKELTEEGFTDLTPTLLGIFAHLAEAEPMSVSSLANRLNVTRQAMHKNTTLLEKLGYISLQIRPSNRKEKMVVLTQKGEKLMAISLKTIVHTEEKMENFLGTQEYKTFLAHQEKLTQLLEELVKG